MGRYCHACGQLDKNLYRPLSEMVLESLSNFIAFDTRFFRTFKPLLFKPGCVARDFMQGRRARYTPPVQLFFFSSIVLFVLLNLVNHLTTDAVSVTEQPRPAVVASRPDDLSTSQEQSDLPSTRQGPGSSTETAPQKNGEEASGNPGEENAENQTANQVEDAEDIDLSGLKQLDVSYLPGPLASWVKSELQKADSKFRRLREDPKALAALVLRHMPLALFLMVPFLALALKGLYAFSGRYYTEHLIFALYLHSFFFLWIALANVGLLVVVLWGEGFSGPWGRVLSVAFWLWLPVHVFLALHHFYVQGWALTSWKYFWLLLVYFVLLVSVITAVGILSLLQF